MRSRIAWSLRFRWSFAPAACLIALSVVTPSAAAQDLAPQSSLADALANPQWIGALRDRLHGDTDVFSQPDPELVQRIYYVASLLNNMATTCGASIHVWTSPVDNPEHALVVSIIAAPSQPTALAEIKAAARRLSTATTEKEKVDLATDAYQQLMTRGFSISALKVDQAGGTATIIMWNGARFNSSNRDALLDFGLFIGLTGASPQSNLVEGKQFSYLFGGGDIRDMAGENESHFIKLCTALGLVKGICDGSVPGHLAKSDLDNDLDNFASQACSPNSPTVMGFKHVDGEIKQAWSKQMP